MTRFTTDKRMSHMSTMYTLTDEAFNSFCDKIEKINKKIAKNGMSGFTVTLINTHFKKIANGYIKIITFSVTSELPMVSHYTFLGYIDHKEHMVVGYHPFDFEPFKNRTVCDHCNGNRVRNKTFIILDTLTNDIKQIGSSCVKEYIGYDCDTIINHCEWFHKIHHVIKTNDNTLSGNTPVQYLDVNDVLVTAEKVINTYGFVKTSLPNSTSYVVKDVLINKSEYSFNTTSCHTEDIISFIDSRGGCNNTFYTNCLTMVKQGYCHVKYVGYLCAAVHTFLQSLKPVMGENTEFYGYPNDTIKNIQVTVIDKKVIVGEFTSTMYSLKKDNHIFVWFNYKNFDANIGDTLHIIKAKIKNHKTYKNINQTIINHVKMKG